MFFLFVFSFLENEFDKHVKDAPPGTPAIYNSLMVWLYAVIGVMMLIGEGNVCQWCKLKHWTTDAFGKMNYRRFSDLIRCIPFIECIVHNIWDVDEKLVPKEFPWDRLCREESELKKPTAKMLNGFHGLLVWCERKKTIYIKFLLSRRFTNMPLLKAAEKVHCDELIEHLCINPTLASDIARKRVQSRYQGFEGQGNVLLWCRRNIQFAQDTPRYNHNNYQGGVNVEQRPLLIKVGLWNNSFLENMIGHLRQLCYNGTLTGANLHTVWRRFMSLRLKLNHRTSPRKRRDLEQMSKDIEEFHDLTEPAQHRAVYLVIRSLCESVVEQVGELDESLEVNPDNE